MDKQILSTVALRYRALYLDIQRESVDVTKPVSVPVLAFTKRLKEHGFCVSEELLHALSSVSVDELVTITALIKDVMRVNLNWTPLVKGWDTPTEECRADHLVTMLANIFGEEAGFKGTTLPCGHLIQEGTFPLERYTGCPFCGTPFETNNFVYTGQGSKLKELRLYTRNDMERVFRTLLSSATPLDETQKDSLKQLLMVFSVPENCNIGMKETAMYVVKVLLEQNNNEQAAKLLRTPSDILRYLWFEKTGYAQIIEPRTLIAHAKKLYTHMWGPLSRPSEAGAKMKENLKLKYDRKTCQRVATWINNLPMTAHQAVENMNPKRGMWVRFIRALRLGEYSRRSGYEHLAEIMDVFYKDEYATWQGNIDKARRAQDATTTLNMLKQRPGVFARCLFATMLRFGADETLKAFEEIADKLPARLLLSLGNAAEMYFRPNGNRVARPITGGAVRIPTNSLLSLYSEDDIKAMIAAVDNIYRTSMQHRFAATETESKSIYIDHALFNIPVSVGDRSTTIQDTSCALMGTRFPVEGDAVRLFMQWGKDLPAQHMDMDLSCRIASKDGKVTECAYFNLHTRGAKHSGDIRSIPNKVGTAEYIELSLPELEMANAQYVTFTCNAYSNGAISPNLVVGWMNSENPMKISEKNGVAYDSSCVQHMVRVSEGNLSKGLVFGILDVAKREIIWLEMPFTSQTIGGCDSGAVELLLQRLQQKLSIGELLQMKATAQNLLVVDSPESADESYTYDWALNPAEVTQLLY